MPPKLRCVIYTRKSSEEGLDQHFNSLHAQREACEAYVRSQVGEGWALEPTLYDDGGYSGGNIERPALRRLLTDVKAGRVDVVVVYKVDRLTRSLPDFAKIVEAFDSHGVSFVSVTQAFNTTTSMGRLTLNVLLSFAQFEREVTGERIRDKIALSKSRGMWMGGNLPLGYDAPTDPTTRALVLNEAEAATVRLIFSRYLELGSVHELKRWLDDAGICSKVCVARNGRERGGASFSRGALFHLLKNRTYLGEIPHGAQSYPGAHPAIIDAELFVAVQGLLADQTRRHAGRPKRSASLALKGLIFDAAGEPMSPTFTRTRSGRSYPYYVSTSLQKGAKPAARHVLRRAPAVLVEKHVVEVMQRIAGRTLSPADAVRRVEVHVGAIHLLADRKALLGRPGVASADAASVQQRLPLDHGVLLEGDDAEMVRIIVPAHLRRSGGRIAITDAEGRAVDTEARTDRALIKALRTAHALMASNNGVIGRPGDALIDAAPANPYERALLKLAFLAPDLQAVILQGRQPTGLTLQSLISSELPVAWSDQRSWVASLR